MIAHQLLTALGALSVFLTCAFLIGNPPFGPLGVAVGILLVLVAATLIFLRSHWLSFELVASTIVAATGVVAGVASAVVGGVMGTTPFFGATVVGVFVASAATKFYLLRYGIGGTRAFIFFSVQFMIVAFTIGASVR